MLSEIKVFKDMFVIFLSSWLLVLIQVYSGVDKISPIQLLIMFLGSIIAWYLFLWPVEYFLPSLYDSKMHDALVSLTTLSAFQLLVLAHKRKLLMKVYKDKTKKYD